MSIDTQKIHLVLFDLDDTLVKPIRGKVFPVTVDDRRLMFRRRAKLDELREQDKKTCIVTNQGGAAWKIFSPDEMNRWLEEFCHRSGIDYYLACYHDTGEKSKLYPHLVVPELACPDISADGHERRKPGPGMLIEAMDHFSVSPENTLMVGDRSEDEAAALAAGTSFVWAWDFFGDEEPA